MQTTLNGELKQTLKTMAKRVRPTPRNILSNGTFGEPHTTEFKDLREWVTKEIVVGFVLNGKSYFVHGTYVKDEGLNQFTLDKLVIWNDRCKIVFKKDSDEILESSDTDKRIWNRFKNRLSNHTWRLHER